MSARFVRHFCVPVLFLLLAALACNIPTPAAGTTPIPPVSGGATDTASAPGLPALPPVSSPAIRAFRMLDADHGWAFSETNLLRTADGGSTWLNATPAGLASIGYPSVFYLDAARAWVLISSGSDFASGTLYRTHDGGASWETISVPFAEGDLKFLDADNGFILAGLGAGAGSEGVAVFQTGDGGATWTRNYINDPNVSGAGDSLPLGGIKSGMTFRDISHGWVSGQTAVDNLVYFYASQDGGHTWAQQSVSTPPAGGMYGADAPVFFDQNNGLLPAELVGSSNSRFFFVTTDGGSSWLPGHDVPGFGKYSLVSASLAFVWDGGPALSVSHDGTQSWTTLHPNIDLTDNLSALQFVNDTTGWALASDADGHLTLYKTVDGGATWAAIAP